jgi:hypothetical protein
VRLPDLEFVLGWRTSKGRQDIDALGDAALRLRQASDVREHGLAPFAVFAALALPAIATSSFAGDLAWAVFLPLRPATRFVD